MRVLARARTEVHGCRIARAPDEAPAGAYRAGVGLVELIVAIVLFTVGMLGLTAGSAVVLRQIRGGLNRSIAATIAHSRFERLEGRPCSEITSGTATVRGMQETWSVSPVGARAMTVRDTVTFANPRGTSKVGITTVVSCTQ